MCKPANEWHPVIENVFGFESEWGLYDPKPDPPTVAIYPEAFARLVLTHPKNVSKKVLVRRGADGIWREAE